MRVGGLVAAEAHTAHSSARGAWGCVAVEQKMMAWSPLNFGPAVHFLALAASRTMRAARARSVAALALSALLPLVAQGSTKSVTPPATVVAGSLPVPFSDNNEVFGEGGRLLNITASSLYDAGVQQGTLARSRIQSWLSGEEMSALFAFATDDPRGSKAFNGLKRDNSAAFPELVQVSE